MTHVALRQPPASTNKLADTPTSTWDVDHFALQRAYLVIITGLPAIVGSVDERNASDIRVLIIGLGGGAVDSYLHATQPQVGPLRS